MKNVLQTWALTILCFSPALAASDSQKIVIDHALQIPGEVLQPGTYVFRLEDRLSGRAIVRIDDAARGRHSLLLTVPSMRIRAGSGSQLVFFRAAGGTNILRGWQCSGCAKPLEFVYAKAEAVKITADSGQSVLAADPTYDKLPADLSPDDMKVVTLWLLSPERVSQDRGIGLKAAKYVAPVGMPPVPTRSRLPQTASNSYLWAMAGIAWLCGFGCLLALRLLRGERCAS
jgi:hypothetical protein